MNAAIARCASLILLASAFAGLAVDLAMPALVLSLMAIARSLVLVLPDSAMERRPA